MGTPHQHVSYQKRGNFEFGKKKAHISADRPTWFASDPTVRMSEKYPRKWARLIHPW
jgi:hypothetical protein